MRMMTDDNSLAKRAAAGDEAAFQLLLERHYDLLLRVAYRILGNIEDAEDVAHEICVALVKKLKSFKGESKFTTWLYRVAVNAARDFIRRRSSIRDLQETYTQVNALIQAGDAERKEQTRWIYETLAKLDESLRETAVLVLAEGLNHAEAGEVLGVKESTISWRMHEMRKQLKILAEADHD